MNIKNESKINDKNVLENRAAVEHRATWFYLLLDEARKEGLNWDSFARRAIFKCGCFHGNTNFSDIKNLKDFSNILISDTAEKVFESETIELTDEKFILEFNYCPLVAAWIKHTDNEEDISKLCDIAMDGDRGIVSTLEDYNINIHSTIASGADSCHIVIKKRNNI